MNKDIIKKLEKYLFYISILFSITILIHLIYIYLYKDFKEVPIKWWTISEAIIWDFPHFNPLIASNDYNKYINHILYRSLLKYDLNEKTIVSDLANCDISNLLYIECYLENNINWSNWESITTEDIISTFNILKESDINPIASSLLKDITIEWKDWIIKFSSTKKDINILNLFFQPILPKKIIDSLSIEEISWKLPPIKGIYSWKYKIWSIDQNETMWITKIILDKNNNYFKNDVYINKIILKIFNSKNHFLKNQNSINIFNDKDNILWDSIPRLKVFNYNLPQFVWVFLNEEKLKSKNLRSIIFDNINRKEIIEKLGIWNVKEIINPFLNDTDISAKKIEKTIASILKEQWYLTKQELINKNITKNKNKLYSDEIKIHVKPKLKQEDLNYIISPITNKYNFVNEDNILLKWKTNDIEVEFVYVNDYKLKWFKKEDKFFYYRLKEENYETIKEWKNSYRIYFEKNWKKEFKEELFVYYYKDEEKLNKVKKDLIEENNNITTNEKTIIYDREWENEEKSVTNTGNILINKEDLEKLEPNYYYNNNLEPFLLNIIYIESDNNIKKTVNIVKSQLENIWIKIQLFPISMSALTEWLRNDSLNYDMIIIWVNMWYFDFNIFPYFHSSQVKWWYNFSNFKKLSLDIKLEQLKSNNLSKTKILEIEEMILDILRNEQIIKTLYSPNLKLLIDQNIKNYKLDWYLPENIYRFDSLEKSYISKKKIINFKTKWILDFFSFIFNSLF